MRKRSWGVYLVYIVIIMGFIMLGNHISAILTKIRNETYSVNPYLTMLVMIVFYGGLGALLGIGGFIHEARKEGHWKVNLPKLIVMGIPAAYFSLSYLLYFLGNSPVGLFLSWTVSPLMRSGSNIIAVFQLILGYVLITSFTKELT